MSASRSIGWNMGGQIATILASGVSTVILGRLLTPGDFGVFAYAVSIYAMVQWLFQTGMGTYLVRERELDRARIETAYAATLLQGGAATLVIALLSPLMGWFSGDPRVMWTTLAVAVVPLACSPEMAVDGLWLRDGAYRQVALLQFAKAAVQTTVSVAAQLLLGLGVWSLVLGLLGAAATSLVASVWAFARRYQARPVRHRERWQEVRSFGGRNLLLVMGQAGSTRLPELIIGRTQSISLLGHYNRASSTLDMIMRTCSLALARALAPGFYSRARDGGALDREVAELLNALLFVCWPALAGIAVLAQPITRLIYGPQWGIAGDVLPWLCLSFALDTARTGGVESMMVRDRITTNARLELAHAVYAVAFVFAGSAFGLMGVLWAKVLDSFVTLIVYLVAMRRIEALPARRLPRIYAANLLLAGVAAAPAWVMMRGLGHPVQLTVGQFAGAVIGGVLLWTIAAAALQPGYARDMRRIAAGRLAGLRAGRELAPPAP